jgi:anti-anti-sigma regulatory factor
MLRITVHDDPRYVTFQLEGSLAGSWVRELDDCCESTLATHQRPAVRFDLTEVTFIDAAGKAFLAAKHVEGAKLVATGCLMKAIVEEIASNSISDCGRGQCVSGSETDTLNCQAE